MRRTWPYFILASIKMPRWVGVSLEAENVMGSKFVVEQNDLLLLMPFEGIFFFFFGQLFSSEALMSLRDFANCCIIIPNKTYHQIISKEKKWHEKVCFSEVLRQTRNWDTIFGMCVAFHLGNVKFFKQFGFKVSVWDVGLDACCRCSVRKTDARPAMVKLLPYRREMDGKGSKV